MSLTQDYNWSHSISDTISELNASLLTFQHKMAFRDTFHSRQQELGYENVLQRNFTGGTNATFLHYGDVSLGALNGTKNSFVEVGGKPGEYIFDREDVRITFLILYTIVFCSCFLGNLMVILVVTIHWRMRSITNFCLANLAFADLCVGIFCVYQNIITYLMDSWVFGEFLCKMYHFIICLSTTASVLILVVISIERYLAIIHPMTCKQIMTLTRLRITIIFVWILSAVISSPRFYYFSTLSMPLPGQKEEILCLPNRLKYDSKLMDMVSMIMLFLIPLAIISYLYTRIGIVLWKTSDIKMSKPSVSAEVSSSSVSGGGGGNGGGVASCDNQSGKSVKKHSHLNCKHVKENEKSQESEKKVFPSNYESRESPKVIRISHNRLSLKYRKEKCSWKRRGEKKSSQCHNSSINHDSLETLSCKSESGESKRCGSGQQLNSFCSFRRPRRQKPHIITMRLSTSYPKLFSDDKLRDSRESNHCSDLHTCKNINGSLVAVSQSMNNVEIIENRGNDVSKSCEVSIDTKNNVTDKCCNKKSQVVLSVRAIPKRKVPPGAHLRRQKAIRNIKFGAAALQSRRRIIRMLIVVVLAFALGHMPFHARKIWQYWSPKWAPYQAGGIFSTLFTPVTFLVMYGNSGINPILYAFMSQKFRMSFKDLLCCRMRRQPRRAFEMV